MVIFMIHPDDELAYHEYFNQQKEHLKITRTTTETWDKFYKMYYLFFPPMDFAYSLTVHKSQGSTYNTVLLDANDLFSVCRNNYSNDEKEEHLRKCLYTAGTRAANQNH
eukprot:Pgem_evm2s20157